MKAAPRRFLSIFTLVSRIPLAIPFEPDYSRADFWLPLVGVFPAAFALVGAFLGSALFGSPAFVALLSVLVQYAAFNLFHFDGLLDSADAMLPMATPERRLEILKDSRIGSYAFFVGSIYLGLRLAALAELAGDGGLFGGRAGSLFPPRLIAALLAAPVAGGAASALIPRIAVPARPRGLGALMKGFSSARLGLGFALGLVPLAAWGLLAGRAGLALESAAVAAAAALLAGLYFARLYSRKAGGFTGDALGAASELAELLCLLAAAALARAAGD
ncbi:MAG TPA: adenosylcobinamide-GDP ribazoletransferase [Spirochaetales bacterium]|nr:adenosylcobinamide-GDP ribazoletransferase [Spirochaetales bacterium]HRY54799.1 adenosylcobinamide-GDP ribazoletransferase [Spirochaetia bacterium]